LFTASVLWKCQSKSKKTTTQNDKADDQGHHPERDFQTVAPATGVAAVMTTASYSPVDSHFKSG